MSVRTPKRRWHDSALGRMLRVANLATALVALALAIMALTGLTVSRRDSARDSCQLFRGLVHAATPPGRAAAAAAYIAATPLKDCNLYARHIVK